MSRSDFCAPLAPPVESSHGPEGPLTCHLLGLVGGLGHLGHLGELRFLKQLVVEDRSQVSGPSHAE